MWINNSYFCIQRIFKRYLVQNMKPGYDVACQARALWLNWYTVQKTTFNLQCFIIILSFLMNTLWQGWKKYYVDLQFYCCAVLEYHIADSICCSFQLLLCFHSLLQYMVAYNTKGEKRTHWEAPTIVHTAYNKLQYCNQQWLNRQITNAKRSV